jgi:hypothetical protein
VNKKPKQRAQQVHSLSILRQFDCVVVSYNFVIPFELFNLKAFSRTTSLKMDQSWSAAIQPKDRQSGYHVHFKGRVESKQVRLTIEYWDRALKAAAKDEPEPFAESIMSWLGSFIKGASARPMAFARFEKPNGTWRSRFNLPFKVTMADAEVVIDGISLILPRNKFRAFDAFLGITDKTLDATVRSVRSVDFATFNISDEIVSFNEATKIFLEQVT